jgi:hypothetical protein
LVLRGRCRCRVSLSTDQGKTWQDCGKFTDGLDLTDRVKGRRQYFLRFHAEARALARSGLTMVTVCQANSSTVPHLRDGGSTVRFAAFGRAVVSAGPNLDQARAHLVAGKFGTPNVTLELATPRREPVREVYAAAHVQSGNPPRPEVKYQIDYSTDSGKSWRPIVRDWRITRRGDEPPDFWSQSLCWGSARVAAKGVTSVRVRFRNSGGKNYARCEAHLVYGTAGGDRTKVAFAWQDDRGKHRAAHVFGKGAAWKVPTGRKVRTDWVEFEVVGPR